MRLTLRRPEGTTTFWKITRGRKWIGRVYRHADGHYVGKIGDREERGATPEAAFENVGARFLGHASPEALRASNRIVRQKRAVVRQRARIALDEMRRGNFAALDAMFGFDKGDAS